ncbi:hypothetical protein GCM10009841_35760 [Microlunatus panaciterrae]|uniref:DUF4157 domain-containing protein n=1 Tax=Microlunatus panaciterrae TaxID=400768 RepID=A0ABS2RGU9_9ACTN|nr:hypothetical protein [Microlunatus panaciterrae]MBM7798234.1 hypothetical protein [Microlunatus panaciterrae]
MDHVTTTGAPTGWLRLRLLGNLVNLTTPFGLLVAWIGRAQVRRGPRGLYLGEHYRLGFPVADAFTIGNVITTRDSWPELLERNPDLLTHEEGHTWQYLYCLGLPFYPAYAVSMLWSVIRTGDRASANFFERQAGLRIGGYRELPRRSLLQAVRSLLGRGETV